ncbi:MAG: hypothetical protein ACRDJF_00445 [Actinomycetota bacterium]
MLPEVIWMSEASTEGYEPGDREVCISIRDPAAPLPDLSPQFLAVLSLEFADDPEPGWEERRRSITEAQADRVIEFVERHLAARRIVVHCLAGVSRSPSLAAGLMVPARARDSARQGLALAEGLPLLLYGDDTQPDGTSGELWSRAWWKLTQPRVHGGAARLECDPA